MGKIKRTPTRAEGGVTENEKEEFRKVADKYIANAFKTGETNKPALVEAIKGIYRAANLKEPRVVIAPSPYVMACAYGLAAGWWHLKKNGAIKDVDTATRAATLNATSIATRDATWDATLNATSIATRDATSIATSIATRDATRDATWDATDIATRDATSIATSNATRDATWNATRDATDSATEAATWNATDDATRDATSAATRAATYDATYDATANATYYTTRAATRNATEAAIGDATNNATYDAIETATDAAIETATEIAIETATDAATRDATFATTEIETDNATWGATRIATYDATRDATDIATRDATYYTTRDATRNATDNATDNATRDATRDATDAATSNATYDAIENATDAATNNATYTATWNATDAAIENATDDATYNATSNAVKNKEIGLLELAKFFGGEHYKLLLDCISKWINAYQGGNMWSGFLAYADACHNVLGLTGLGCWKNFEPYKKAGQLGGFRVMHEEFCIVSEFPVELHVNENNQAHCETGPSHRWKDGFEIYSLNGIQVPKWIVMTPDEQLDMSMMNEIENADVRTEFIRKIGIDRFVDKGKVIDSYENYNDEWWNKSQYKLVDMSFLFETVNYAPHLYMLNQTIPGVYHLEPVSPSCRSLHDAINERYSVDSSEYEIIDIK